MIIDVRCSRRLLSRTVRIRQGDKDPEGHLGSRPGAGNRHHRPKSLHVGQRAGPQQNIRPRRHPRAAGTELTLLGAISHPIGSVRACTNSAGRMWNQHRRAARSGDAELLGKWSSGSGSRGTRVPRAGSAGPVRGLLPAPQKPHNSATRCPDPHRNPTDETAHSGTLVMYVKDTENSQPAASMRVSWAVGAFSR